MSADTDVGPAVSLVTLADRYQTIKDEVADGLRGRQEASRFGGKPLPEDGTSSGKQDARRIAAERLGAGVSHTTLEKVLWLRRIAFDVERRASLRREAMDALEEIDAGRPVNWPYDRVHTLVLIDDLEQAAAEAPVDSAVKIVAERQLKLLRQRSVYTVTAAMKRQARKALADAERLDRGIDEAVRRIAPALPQLEAALKHLRRQSKAAYDQQVRERLAAMAETPLDSGANP